MDLIHQVYKYGKHAKTTGTDLFYCEIWKQYVFEHECCDRDLENHFNV